MLIDRGLKPNLDQSSDLKSAIRKLLLGRVDVIAYGDQNLHYYMETNKIDIEAFREVFSMTRSSDYYAFSQSTPNAVIAQYQAALNTVKRQKIFTEIQKKYKSGGF